jgi:hypothetical protein
MTNAQKIGAITFTVFMAEALIHYNIGVHKDEKIQGFVFPPSNDLLKLALVVGVFSIVNGVMIQKLTK